MVLERGGCGRDGKSSSWLGGWWSHLGVEGSQSQFGFPLLGPFWFVFVGLTLLPDIWPSIMDPPPPPPPSPSFPPDRGASRKPKMPDCKEYWRAVDHVPVAQRALPQTVAPLRARERNGSTVDGAPRAARAAAVPHGLHHDSLVACDWQPGGAPVCARRPCPRRRALRSAG